MGDAINLASGRHLSGRPATKGAAQQAWDQANPNYYTTGGGSYAAGGPIAMPTSASQGQAGGFAAYRPGQAQSQQSSWSTSTPYGQQNAAAFNPGNYANMSPSQRPPAFQQNMQTPWGAMQPEQYNQQRAAMVQGALNQHSQAAAGAGVFGASAAPAAGAPAYNPDQLWSQAGEMVEQGWQNPFAAPPPTSPGGQFQDLFQQYNFQPPPGFMDALIGRLQGNSPQPPSQPPPPVVDGGNQSPSVADQLRQALQERRDTSATTPPPRRQSPGPRMVTGQVMLKDKWGRKAGFSPKQFKEINGVLFEPGLSAWQKAEGWRLDSQGRPMLPGSQKTAAPKAPASQGRLPGTRAEAVAQGWQLQPDGSYSRPGTHASTIPGKNKAKPRVINWGSMTPQQLAKEKSPYLGGKWPTVKKTK